MKPAPDRRNTTEGTPISSLTETEQFLDEWHDHYDRIADGRGRVHGSFGALINSRKSRPGSRPSARTCVSTDNEVPASLFRSTKAQFGVDRITELTVTIGYYSTPPCVLNTVAGGPGETLEQW